MTTLEGKTLVVVGGSSGIGFAVAKAALISLASHVVIASANPSRVQSAIQRLDQAITGKGLPGKISSATFDVTDLPAVKDYFENLGEIDHLIWTSGDPLKLGFPNVDITELKGAFDVRFWGAFMAAQQVKIKPGGSITLTIGSVNVKPQKGWSVPAAITGAVESVTRGLAVDLAPVRVNVICPGLVDTELWDGLEPSAKEAMFKAAADKLLVKHVATADEIAEAYLFVMKCNYITGQRIEVDGGFRFA